MNLSNYRKLYPFAIRTFWQVLMVGFLLLIGACGPITPKPVFTTSPTPTYPPLPTATHPPSPTPTPQPPRVILLAPPESDPALGQELQQTLSALIANSAFNLKVQPSLSIDEIGPEVKVVVAIQPAQYITVLAKAAHHTQFLATGFDPGEQLSNLSSIHPPKEGGNETAFMAGAMAAILTQDWRVGLIQLENSTNNAPVRQAFGNGMTYFCGLCRPALPPYISYPLTYELPASASEDQIQSLVNQLTQGNVQTVYISPEAQDPKLTQALEAAGIAILGTGATPTGSASTWVASLSWDFNTSLQGAWPDIIQGKGGLQLTPPLVIQVVNAKLLSPGKQALVDKILQDLNQGYIDIGIR